MTHEEPDYEKIVRREQQAATEAYNSLPDWLKRIEAKMRRKEDKVNERKKDT